ncbi:hypothetical protein ACFLSP_02160 [Bacteroidota bacterium]
MFPVLRNIIIFTLLIALSVNQSYCQDGKDKGYFLLGPEKETFSKDFNDGKRLLHYTHEGMIVSDNSESPWNDASMYVQGSALVDKDGKRIADVALCESTDPDGDLCWFVFWASEDGSELTIKAGTGKWKNIAGSAVFLEGQGKRADGYFKFPWELSWKILADNELPGPIDPGKYEFHDKGLSFHGPHVKSLDKQLSNGVNLLYSDQCGVLLSENKDAVSPRNFATCFDRGTTYIYEGSNLGDCMLLEDTDPDGDIVWLYHEWWYGKGPGSYEFIGGTGKWKGITGRGVTLGMLKARTDDHFMLRSEMHWNIEE